MIEYTSRNKIHAFLMSMPFILISGLWSSSIIIRYEYSYYVVISTLVAIIAFLCLVNLPKITLPKAILSGALIGYLVGLLLNFILEFIFVENHLANFFNGVQKQPFQVLIVFFTYPLFLTSWFLGIGLGTSVWFLRRKEP